MIGEQRYRARGHKHDALGEGGQAEDEQRHHGCGRRGRPGPGASGISRALSRGPHCTSFEAVRQGLRSARSELAELLDALAKGTLLSIVDPSAADAGIDDKCRLAMVIDPFDVDRDGCVFRSTDHPILEDPRRAPSGERDVTIGEDGERHLRALAQTRQRPAITPQAEKDQIIRSAQRGGDRYRVRSPVHGGQDGDRLGRPFGQRVEPRVLA